MLFIDYTILNFFIGLIMLNMISFNITFIFIFKSRMFCFYFYSMSYSNIYYFYSIYLFFTFDYSVGSFLILISYNLLNIQKINYDFEAKI